MHAYQPERQPQPTATPRKRRRAAPQRQRQQSRRQKATLIELTLHMSVNCLLFTVAIATIVKLLPYHLTQQEKLADLRVEVEQAEVRVGKLRQDFNKNFDAYNNQRLMQEGTTKVDPNQKRVIWVEPESTPAQP